MINDLLEPELSTMNTLKLNVAQLAAVEAALGHCLVLAGAGSGKTRVLVQRIACLIEKYQVSPYSILAVTFTNKAASEMKHRLSLLLDNEVSNMWVGTFHGLGHKLLRMHYQEAKLPRNFQVIDSQEQLQIIKKVFKQLSINEERFEPKKAQGFINHVKNDAQALNHSMGQQTYFDEIMQSIYQAYEKYCHSNGLIDFSDLLLKSYELLNNNPELALHYQHRFKHFLVDEFQDTNNIQYEWLKILTRSASSVMVVGDDDQSIYGWRGAKIENIHRFQQDYNDTNLVRLEQNYRSTHIILAAANALIANNTGRMGKTLWTESNQGERIDLYQAFNEEDEALFIARQIKKWVDQGGSYQDVGILYRSNAQSRVLEEAMMRVSLPYTIYGGLRFFERAEIKDALAYLRFSFYQQDENAFERIINMPPRGIGAKSLEKIKQLASDRAVGIWDAASIALNEKLLSGKAKLGLQNFIESIQAIEHSVQNDDLTQIIETVVKQSGLLLFYQEQKGERALSKAENLSELINATIDFDQESLAYSKHSQIDAFLAYTVLEAGERSSKGVDGNAVQLMTLHSAKGLEFPLVFMSGLEEGLFPNAFVRDSAQALEEERRLCYVGITRAKKKLYLCHAESRRLFGRDEQRRPSRFIAEVPSQLIQSNERQLSVNKLNRYAYVPTVKPIPNFSSQNESGYNLGQRIKHPKFGVGIIVDCEGEGERTRIHVHFDLVGNKWLALNIAKIERL